MKRTKLSVLMAALLLITVLGQAQTVDSLIGKYIDAIGGQDKINAVNSVIMQSTTEVMGNENETTVTILNGKDYKSESDNNGQKYVQCFNEKGGWQINPYSGSDTPQPMTDEQFKEGKIASDVGGELFNYAAKGNKAELEGTEKIGDVLAYKIKLTTPDGISMTYYLDPTTYYIIRLVRPGDMMGQSIDLVFNFSDYRKTDFGLVMPFKTDVAYGDQFDITINVKKIDFNLPVDPSIFDMPKS